MVPREQSDVKERILDAALTAFSEHGYDGATIRQIAEHSSTNVALVSYHFGGKEQLFFEMFERNFPRFEPWSDGGNPVEALRGIVDQMIRFKAEHSCLANIMHHEAGMSTCRMQGLSGYAQPLWDRVKGCLQAGAEGRVFKFERIEIALFCVMSVLLMPKELTVCPDSKSNTNGCIDHVIYSTSTFLLQGLGYLPEA